MFGRFPALHLNPDEAIALGAAIQAGLKMRDKALEEIVMTDVAPYSLGIAISRQVGPTQYDPGHYLPIIERNSTVPISRTESITTIRDDQKELSVLIFQGESRLVKDNVFLGKIEFPIPAKKPVRYRLISGLPMMCRACWKPKRRWLAPARPTN